LIPKFYKYGANIWKLENKGSWRDNNFSGSTINLNYRGLNLLSVICVRKEINGNNETCEDIDECEIGDYDCGQGECKNNPGSYSCDCFDGFINFMNDQSQICGNFPNMNIAEKSDDCTISAINDTAVVYETEDPYHSGDECNAEFSCPNGQVLRYSIQRFEIEEHSSCEYDSLGLYINQSVCLYVKIDSVT